MALTLARTNTVGRASARQCAIFRHSCRAEARPTTPGYSLGKCHSYLLLLLLALPTWSLATDDVASTELLFGYGSFLQAIETGDWPSAEGYIAEATKVGFGGDMGKAGFKAAVVDDPVCRDNLIFALRQGCKLQQEGGQTGCVSPPQFGDPDILYLGSRIKFIYTAADSVAIEYLVCGGD